MAKNNEKFSSSEGINIVNEEISNKEKVEKSVRKSVKKEINVMDNSAQSLEKELKEAHLTIKKMQEEIANLNLELQDKRLKMASGFMTQRAFIELAIQYGLVLGKTPFEVKKEGYAKEMDVLLNKHNPLHQTNSIPLFEKLFNELSESIKTRHYNFQNECIPLVLAGKIHVIGDEHYTYWFEALEHWLVLAREGNKEAQQNVWECFKKGYGTDPHPKQADYWEKVFRGFRGVKEPALFDTTKNIDHHANEGKLINSQNFQGKDEISDGVFAGNVVFPTNIEPNGLVNAEENGIDLVDKKVEKLKKEKSEIFEKLKTIQITKIKPFHLIEKLTELSRIDGDISDIDRLREYGSPLCLHTAEFIFEVSPLRNVGSFLMPDKRGDLTMTIVNSSDWEPEFFIKVEDENGEKTKMRYRLVKGETKNIKLLTNAKVGTKVKSIEFETMESPAKNYLIIPKNAVIS